MKQLVYVVKDTGYNGSPSETPPVLYVYLEMIQPKRTQSSKDATPSTSTSHSKAGRCLVGRQEENDGGEWLRS